MALTDNTRGALLMALAMASFTANDALTKSVTPYINTGQIMFVRGIMTVVLIYIAARHFGALRPLKTLMRPIIILRCLCEVTAAVLYLTALGLIEFSNASAILQSLPLIVTLGAALFLREPVGWRRWAAIIVGFIGVLVIIRPGPEGFTSGALLVVASLAVTAARDLLTRKMYADVPSLAVTFGGGWPADPALRRLAAHELHDPVASGRFCRSGAGRLPGNHSGNANRRNLLRRAVPLHQPALGFHDRRVLLQRKDRQFHDRRRRDRHRLGPLHLLP